MFLDYHEAVVTGEPQAFGGEDPPAAEIPVTLSNGTEVSVPHHSVEDVDFIEPGDSVALACYNGGDDVQWYMLNMPSGQEAQTLTHAERMATKSIARVYRHLVEEEGIDSGRATSMASTVVINAFE